MHPGGEGVEERKSTPALSIGKMDPGLQKKGERRQGRQDRVLSPPLSTEEENGGSKPT